MILVEEQNEFTIYDLNYLWALQSENPALIYHEIKNINSIDEIVDVDDEIICNYHSLKFDSKEVKESFYKKFINTKN